MYVCILYIHQGLPKKMWAKVLHRRRCVFYDEARGEQCGRAQPLFGDARDGQAINPKP